MAGRFDAIVIGAGANGLVAAAALGRAGLRVLLLERGGAAGGRAAALEFAPGHWATFTDFDAGWLPPVVSRGLGLEGLERQERVSASTPLSVVVGEDEVLALSGQPSRAADAIRRFSPGDAAKWPAFTAELRAYGGFLESLYQAPAPQIDASGRRELLDVLGLGRRLRRLGRDRMTGLLRTVPMPVQDLVEDWFEYEPLAAAVAGGGVLDSRQGPRSAGTAFVLLHHLAGAAEGCIRGRGYWRSGPGALIAALESAARAAGVTIRLDAPVARITVQDDAVSGVVLESGEEIRAQRVLSTADPARTLLGLIDPVWLDPDFMLAVRNIRFRGCTSLACFAVDELPALRGLDADTTRDVLAGTLSLSAALDDLQRAADACKYGRVPEHQHVELTVPTLRWPSMAADGGHVLVARAQYSPYRLRSGDEWDAARREALADAVTARVESALPGFTGRIRYRAVWTPPDIEARFGLTEGALTHGELGLDQILFMRPLAGWSRYGMPIDGLYLGGAGTHPGPGVPGGAGWLAAGSLLAERTASRR